MMFGIERAQQTYIIPARNVVYMIPHPTPIIFLSSPTLFLKINDCYKFLSLCTKIQHHLQQQSGLAYGVSLGFRESTGDTSLQGFIGLMFGLNVITFFPIIYLNLYLNAQQDTYKSSGGSLNFVGVQNAFALMMLLWITFYTMVHEEEEGALGRALVDVVVKSAGGDIDADVGSDGVGASVGEEMVDSGVPVEDSEF